MKIFRNYIYLVLIFGVSVSCVNAAVVKIFDVGQGNCVAIKHGRKVLLLDAGSSERAFLAAYQQASQTGKLYTTLGEEGHPGEKAHGSSIDMDLPEEEAAAEPASQSPSSEESVSPSDAAGAISEKHGLSLKNSIREFIGSGDVAEIVVVATHGDKDHIGWLPQLLDENFEGRDRLRAVILSGFSNDYTSVLGEWLAGLGDDRVIYTGTYTGKAGYPEGFYTPWSLGLERQREEAAVLSGEPGAKKRRVEEDPTLFARFYHSRISDKTGCERRIEEALHFGDLLEVEILSMNSGMAMDRVSLGAEAERWHISRANMDSNANSLVLRIVSSQKNGKSILLTGDADETTWGRIAAQGLVKPVTYMMLSHHGSQEHGATSRAMIGLFKPQAFLLSAGQHKAYHHPAYSVIEMCRHYLKDRFALSKRVDDHSITYFRPEEKAKGKIVYTYRRRLTKLPLFSTITQGTMKIDLEEGDEGEIKIGASRDRSRLFVYEEGPRKILYLASGLQTYKSEEEACTVLVKNSSGKIILFKEGSIEPSPVAEKERAAIKILSGKQQIYGEKKVLEEEDVALETEDRYYVLRKKKEQIFVYDVFPYEEDPDEP